MQHTLAASSGASGPAWTQVLDPFAFRAGERILTPLTSYFQGLSNSGEAGKEGRGGGSEWGPLRPTEEGRRRPRWRSKSQEAAEGLPFLFTHGCYSQPCLILPNLACQQLPSETLPTSDTEPYWSSRVPGLLPQLSPRKVTGETRGPGCLSTRSNSNLMVQAFPENPRHVCEQGLEASIQFRSMKGRFRNSGKGK